MHAGQALSAGSVGQSESFFEIIFMAMHMSSAEESASNHLPNSALFFT